MSTKACFLVPVYDKKILVQLRPSREWGFFGGKRLYGESVMACALREFQEESGIRPAGKFSIMMKQGPYIIIRHDPRHKYSRIYKNNETLGYNWIDPNRLRGMKIVKELKGYLPKFLTFFTEGTMSNKNRSVIALTKEEAVETIAVLQGQNRSDLAVAFATEVFGSKKTTVKAEEESSTTTLEEDSVRILKEKAAKLIDNLKRDIKKDAEGDVEADLLLKCVIKELSSPPTEEKEEEEETEGADETEEETKEKSEEEEGK